MILSGICKRGLKKKLANLSKELTLLYFLICTLLCSGVVHVGFSSILFSFGHHSSYVLIVSLWELVGGQISTDGFCSNFNIYCLFSYILWITRKSLFRGF